MSWTALWPWVVLLVLGAFHGLNPGMGWLFAVALGLQERRRAMVYRALGPIALGVCPVNHHGPGGRRGYPGGGIGEHRARRECGGSWGLRSVSSYPLLTPTLGMRVDCKALVL